MVTKTSKNSVLLDKSLVKNVRKVKVSRYSLSRALFKSETNPDAQIHYLLNEMYNEFCAQERKAKKNIRVLTFDVNSTNRKAIEYITQSINT